MNTAARRIRRRFRHGGPFGLASSAPLATTNGPGTLATGFALLAVGGVFLAERIGALSFFSEFFSGLFSGLLPGMFPVSMETAWPLILVVVGVSLLLSAPFRRTRSRKDPGQVLPGLINLQLGAFFLLFTTGRLDFSQMESLWPVFPLIVGIAFAGAFVASLGRKPRLLVPGFICFSVGTIGLAFTLTPLGDLLAFLGWPVVLLALGAIFVLGGMIHLVARSLFALVRA